MHEVLREDMGGVYGVQVNAGISRRPRQEYTLSISFGCLPENVEKLESASFETIHALQQDGVSEDYLVKVKEARRRSHETELSDNGYWLRELQRACEEHSSSLHFIGIAPEFVPLRSDKRFVSIVERIGLVPQKVFAITAA